MVLTNRINICVLSNYFFQRNKLYFINTHELSGYFSHSIKLDISHVVYFLESIISVINDTRSDGIYPTIDPTITSAKDSKQ